MGLTASQADLVAEHRGMVRRVVNKMLRTLPASAHNARDEMESDGYVALCNAARKYDGEVLPGKALRYLYVSIWGGVVDGLRSRRWGHRAACTRSPQLMASLLNTLAAAASAREGASAASAEAVDARDYVDWLLQTLTWRQRQVVDLCFFQNRTGQEAAEVLGVTRAYVSRVKDAALANMRSRVGAA